MGVPTTTMRRRGEEEAELYDLHVKTNSCLSP